MSSNEDNKDHIDSDKASAVIKDALENQHEHSDNDDHLSPPQEITYNHMKNTTPVADKYRRGHETVTLSTGDSSYVSTRAATRAAIRAATRASSTRAQSTRAATRAATKYGFN